jgi:hypothetical protein
VIGGANHFFHQVEHVALCVRDPKRPVEPSENGLAQTLATEAAEQAWLSGLVTEVPEV